MRSPTPRTLLLAIALGAVLLAPLALAANSSDNSSMDRMGRTEASITGHYTGLLVDPDPVFPRRLSHQIKIDLDRLTPLEELERMIGILDREGQDALESELWNQKVGTVQIDSDLAHPIAAAFLIEGDRGMGHLVLVVDRPMSIGEVFNASRSTKYPFSVIEIDLEEDGNASGELMVAAQMSYADGTLTIENLAFQPVRILDVDRTPNPS